MKSRRSVPVANRGNRSLPVVPAAPTSKRPKIDWRPILLEASFVVLGVILALGANEWRRAQLDRRNAETALAAIHDELHVNRQAVLQSARYHRNLLDTLTTFTRNVGTTPSAARPLPDGRLFAGGFFQPATILHTAWDAAAAVDAVRHMRYEEVMQLAEVYEAQTSYRNQSAQVGELIFARLFTEGYQSMLENYQNLTNLLGAFWYRECQLLRYYEEVVDLTGGTADTANLEIGDLCRDVPPG